MKTHYPNMMQYKASRPGFDWTSSSHKSLFLGICSGTNKFWCGVPVCLPCGPAIYFAFTKNQAQVWRSSIIGAATGQGDGDGCITEWLQRHLYGGPARVFACLQADRAFGDGGGNKHLQLCWLECHCGGSQSKWTVAGRVASIKGCHFMAWCG